MTGWNIPDWDSAYDKDLQAAMFETDTEIVAAGFASNNVATGCAVTAQSTPDMTVHVAAGSIRQAGVLVAVSAGNLTVNAADGTYGRIDLVSVDPAGALVYTAGSATSQPKPPLLPSATHVALAFLAVAANAPTITNSRITDKRIIVPAAGVTRSAVWAECNTPPTTNTLFTWDTLYDIDFNVIGSLPPEIGLSIDVANQKFTATEDISIAIAWTFTIKANPAGPGSVYMNNAGGIAFAGEGNKSIPDPNTIGTWYGQAVIFLAAGKQFWFVNSANDLTTYAILTFNRLA